MSTVRIQVRRGTASQWTSVNPILAAGEMGVESDTNLFKFGNGSSTWTALAYANNSDVAIGEISQDAINSALVVGDGLTKTYNDGANTITIAVADSYFTEMAQDAVNTALVAGNGISKSYNDGTNELTVSVDTSVIANKGYVDSAVSALGNTVDLDYIPLTDRGNAGGVASLNNSGKVPASELDITNTITSLIDSTVTSGRGVSSTWDSGTSKEVVSAAIRAQGGIVKTDATDNLDIILSLSPTITATTKFTGPLVQVDEVQADTATLGALTVSGNLTVNGTTTSVNSTNYTVEDPMIYIGEGNQSNALDLGLVGAFNDGTYQHAGLVRDASDGVWKLFSGVTAEPTTVVDFTTYTKDTLQVGGLFTDALRVGAVVNAEVQHLAGVTSGIQSQIDSKIASTEAASVYAPKASPTFTGTVTLPEGTVTSGMIANGTVVNADVNEYAEIAQSKIANLTGDLAGKAPKISPTFTGSVILPTDTTIGDVSATELGYVNGVTSGIQYQIDTVSNALAAKVTSYDSSIATLFTDTSTLTTDLNTAENAITGLQSEVTAINTAAATLQTSVNTKASSASLTAHEADTTNIHGIADTSALALTADVNTALDLKAPLASPTFTGTVTLPATNATADILPSIDNTHSLGSPTKMWKDIYVGPGSLYVNGQKVLQDESGAIVVSADINENLGLRTSGSGNIELDPTGTGSVNIKGPLVVEAGANFSSADGNGIVFSNGVKSDSITSKSTDTDLSLSGNGTGKVYLNDNAEVNGNLVVGGNLTVTGTTVTVNTETISLADNIIDLNSNHTTGTPTENAGIRVIRGDSNAVQMRWNESSDKWEFTNDGTAYSTIAPTDSPTFTGTVTIPAGASIAGFAPLASPTFTGTVTLPAEGIVFSDGTQARAGVPSITTIATEVVSSVTLGAGEQDKFIPLSGAVVVTLPATGYSTGQSIDFWQKTGTGASFADTNGVIGTPGRKFRANNSVVTALKISTGWLIFGDLTA